MVQPFYQATVAEYTPAGLRGLSYGFTYLGVFGVGALGGAIAGSILAVANATALFGTLAGIALSPLSPASLSLVAVGRRELVANNGYVVFNRCNWVVTYNTISS